MLTGSGFLLPLHRAHPANQNGKAIHLRRLRLLLAVQTGQPIGDPASVYDSALCPQIARLRRALQLPIAVRRALPCVVYRSAHGAAVQAAIWQLGASQSWRANANHCSANTKSLCYLKLLFVEQLKPG